MKDNAIVMCILSGQSEQCNDECPLYKICWNQEEMEKKKNA
jgi:hypothetical protein